MLSTAELVDAAALNSGLNATPSFDRSMYQRNCPDPPEVQLSATEVEDVAAALRVGAGVGPLLNGTVALAVFVYADGPLPLVARTR